MPAPLGIDWRAEFGREPRETDTAIAARLKLPVSTVAAARRRLGIAAAAPRGRPKKAGHVYDIPRIRLSEDEAAKLDAFAELVGAEDRADAIRRLIRSAGAALNSEKRKQFAALIEDRPGGRPTGR